MFPTQEQLLAVQAEQIERVAAACKRLPISDVMLLADAIEQHHPSRVPSFQSATGGLAVSIMRKLGVKMRVAVWHVVNGRCEHKEYSIGNEVKARIGNIGDDTWVEAWIA